MGLLSKVAGAALGGVGGVTSSLGLGDIGGGYDAPSAILSGIPIIGEGFAAQQQQQFSAKQAQQQMAFQKRMSDTSHQREVKDLKAAGLNPILSANAGASAPAGAMAQGQSGSGAGNSAKLMQDLLNKERDKAKAVIAREHSAKQLNLQQVDLAKKQGEKVDAEKAGIKFDNAGRKNEATIQETLGPWLNEIRKGGLKRLFSGGASSAKKVKSLPKFKGLKSSQKYKTHITGNRKHIYDAKTGEYIKTQIISTKKARRKLP